jgi:hypothetical protein
VNDLLVTTAGYMRLGTWTAPHDVLSLRVNDTVLASPSRQSHARQQRCDRVRI